MKYLLSFKFQLDYVLRNSATSYSFENPEIDKNSREPPNDYCFYAELLRKVLHNQLLARKFRIYWPPSKLFRSRKFNRRFELKSPEMKNGKNASLY